VNVLANRIAAAVRSLGAAFASVIKATAELITASTAVSVLGRVATLVHRVYPLRGSRREAA
jgi:hypothetical protein